MTTHERAEPVSFGSGKYVVDTGAYGDVPAVFISKASSPGVVGESAASEGHDRYSLQPEELVLTFPTDTQAVTVADALVNAPLPDHLTAMREARDALAASFKFISSEYASAEASALQGDPLSTEARPVRDKLCDALFTLSRILGDKS